MYRRTFRLSLLLALTAGIPVPAVCQDFFAVFPQMAVGGGYCSDFKITNQGQSTASGLKLAFFNDDASPLEVVTEGGEVSEITFDLAPGAGRSIAAGRDGAATPAYAVLTFPAPSSVRGTLQIRFVQEGRITVVGVGQHIPASHFTFAAEVDTEQEINTGVAFANGAFQLPGTPAPRAQSFVVDLINPDGSLSRRSTLELLAGEHLSLFLDDARLFPGLDGFSGSVSVSAGLDFGLLALRLEQGDLSSLSIDAGPNLGALDFTAGLGTTAEMEANDSVQTAQALNLPARIGADLSVFGDSDVYSFQAEAGDLLTAYVTTPSGSNLDSFLTLERMDGSLLAVNDQNGLFAQNDSFLRLVLPEAGLFFLRLEDFFLGGGVNFDYSLTVGLESESQ